MNFSALERFLQERFPAADGNAGCCLSESGMKALFNDIGLDSGYAPVFSHVVARNGETAKITDLLGFFNVLLSGDQRRYCEYVFHAMDVMTTG
jgi:hypothetical protein